VWNISNCAGSYVFRRVLRRNGKVLSSLDSNTDKGKVAVPDSISTAPCGYIDPRLHDLGIVGGEWSASHPGRFTPRGKRPRYQLDNRLSGPQSRTGRYEKVKILDPTGTRTPTPSVVHPVARRYTAYVTTTKKMIVKFSV
jgi:hypothetical protein